MELNLLVIIFGIKDIVRVTSQRYVVVTDVYLVFFMYTYFVTIQDLLTYNLGELYKLWDEVQHHSAERQMWINELDKQLSKVEDDRIDMVRLDFMLYMHFA